MGEMKKVKQNTIYNFLTIVVTKVITLVLIILLARYLGTEGYGKMSFALGFTALFSIVGDFGISLLIKRYISREPHNVDKYINTSFILKILFNTIGLALIFVTALVLQYSSEQMELITIAAGIVFFANLGPFRSAYDSFEKMNLTFFTRTSKVLIRLGLVLFLIFSGGTVKSILFVYFLSEVLLLIIEIITYNRTIGTLKFTYEKKLAKKLIKESIPFGLAALFMTVYDKIDITMLSKMATNPDVVIGLYGSSYELMSAVAFLPGILTGALAPIAFRNKNNKKTLGNMFNRTYSIFSVFALPIMVGVTILAKDVITLIYGIEFIAASLALQILIWSVFFQFQMFSIGLILNAIHLEKITMQATMISVVVNIILNFFLIPAYSYIGASIATVLSVITYFTYCSIFVHKNIKTSFFIPLLKPLFACVVMSVMLILTQPYLHVILLIILAAGVYFGTLKLIKGIHQEDIQFILGK